MGIIERRDELGLLYSCRCAHCDWYVDDHEDPYKYGHNEEGCPEEGKCNIFECPGFQVAEDGLEDVITVTARILFWENYHSVPEEFFDDDRGIIEQAEALMEEKREEWEKEKKVFEKKHENDHIWGGQIVIVPGGRGGSFVIDIGL